MKMDCQREFSVNLNKLSRPKRRTRTFCWFYRRSLGAVFLFFFFFFFFLQITISLRDKRALKNYCSGMTFDPTPCGYLTPRTPRPFVTEQHSNWLSWDGCCVIFWHMHIDGCIFRYTIYLMLHRYIFFSSKT